MFHLERWHRISRTPENRMRRRVQQVAMVVAAVAVASLTIAGCDRPLPKPYTRLDGPAPQIEDAPAARALLVAFWADLVRPVSGGNTAATGARAATALRLGSGRCEP